MKQKTITVLLILILSIQLVNAQENTKDIILDIREKYKILTSNMEYDSTYVDYFNSEDNSEDPNSEGEPQEVEAIQDYTYTYYYKNEKLVFIEKKDRYLAYCQGNREEKTQEKAYYWEGKLFFIYKKSYLNAGGMENYKETYKEERIYIHNDKPIKYLTKKFEPNLEVNSNDDENKKAITKMKNTESEIDEDVRYYVKSYSKL